MSTPNLPFLLDHLRDIRRLMFGPAPDFMSARAELDRLIDMVALQPRADPLRLSDEEAVHLRETMNRFIYGKEVVRALDADKYCPHGVPWDRHCETCAWPRGRPDAPPSAPGKQKETEL